MERSAWTDERIDDLAARGESQFELLRTEMREARADTRRVADEVAQLRTDMQAEFASVRRDMFHGAIALFAALAAMYATSLAHLILS